MVEQFRLLPVMAEFQVERYMGTTIVVCTNKTIGCIYCIGCLAFLESSFHSIFHQGPFTAKTNYKDMTLST